MDTEEIGGTWITGVGGNGYGFDSFSLFQRLPVLQVHEFVAARIVIRVVGADGSAIVVHPMSLYHWSIFDKSGISADA